MKCSNIYNVACTSHSFSMRNIVMHFMWFITTFSSDPDNEKWKLNTNILAHLSLISPSFYHLLLVLFTFSFVNSFRRLILWRLVSVYVLAIKKKRKKQVKIFHFYNVKEWSRCLNIWWRKKNVGWWSQNMNTANKLNSSTYRKKSIIFNSSATHCSHSQQ